VTLEEVFLQKEALKYLWLSIHIHDPMMKERSWNLQGMESIENSMDPRAKRETQGRT
jgi:predicted acetyltransferase